MTRLAEKVTSSHLGLSKRERYSWTITDQPGDFAKISKKELRVDQSYQRKHSEAKINNLAKEWSWVACGAISVALRSDGEWFVMDGQHRVLAALKRDDIDVLPCMVFDINVIAEEARGFLATNTNRKAMNAADKFKALLMTEDHAARIVNELVSFAGRTVQSGGGSSPTAFSAVSAMLLCVKEDEQAMRRAWPAIMDVCEGKRIIQPFIAGMWYLERNLLDDESLWEPKWRKRLAKIGYEELLRSINSAAAFYGSGKGNKISAVGILQAINKGLRKPLRSSILLDRDE